MMARLSSCGRNKQEMKTKVAVSKFGSNHKTSPWGGGEIFSFLTYSPSTSQLYSTPIPPPWLQTPKHITGAQIYISSQTFNNKTINSTTSTIDITQKTARLDLHHRFFNQQIIPFTLIVSSSSSSSSGQKLRHEVLQH